MQVVLMEGGSMRGIKGDEIGKSSVDYGVKKWLVVARSGRRPKYRCQSIFSLLTIFS